MPAKAFVSESGWAIHVVGRVGSRLARARYDSLSPSPWSPMMSCMFCPRTFMGKRGRKLVSNLYPQLQSQSHRVTSGWESGCFFLPSAANNHVELDVFPTGKHEARLGDGRDVSSDNFCLRQHESLEETGPRGWTSTANSECGRHKFLDEVLPVLQLIVHILLGILHRW